MCYFLNLFKNSEATIDAISHAVNNPIFDRPNRLIGIGLSGAIPLMGVSIKTGIPFSVIRKDGYDRATEHGGCHSPRAIEPNCRDTDRYIIIDDQVCSGRTVRFIKRTAPGQCVGIIFYQDPWGDDEDVPVICVEDTITEVVKLRGTPVVLGC